MRPLTLCFWLFETTTIELVVKDIAEEDATGRYIPFPLVCRWLFMPSGTPFGAYIIPTTWVSLCLFTTKAVVGHE